MKKRMNLLNHLAKAGTEEAVKAKYVKYYGLPFINPDRADLLCNSVLFEFKYQKNLKKTWPRVVAQAIYYVREIMMTGAKTVPTYICIADKDEAALTPTGRYKPLMEHGFDWERTPSSPDPELVKFVRKLNSFRVYDLTSELEAFSAGLNAALKDEEILTRPITALNYESVFEAWKDAVGVHITGGDLGRIFVADVLGGTILDEVTGDLIFRRGGRSPVHVSVKEYLNFWMAYDLQNITAKTRRTMRAHQDRLTILEKRRFEGEYYTPPRFAEKGVELLDKVLGEDWQDEYLIYDPACYAEDTEVLTDSGWKLFPDLDPEDKIYSLNPETAQGEYVEIVAFQEKDHDGEMHSYACKRMDTLVTPDHQMYFRKREPGGRITDKGYFLSSKDAINLNEDGRCLRFFGAAVKSEDEGGNGVAEWNEDHYRLLGFWLGDGYTFKDAKGKRNAIGFGLRKARKITYVKDLLTKLGMEWTTGVGADGKTWVRCNEPEFLSFVVPLGGAHEKHIPEEVVHSSYGNLTALLDGLWNSDGCDHCYYSCNKRLAEDVGQVAIHLGHAVRVTNRMRSSIIGGRVVEGLSYEVSVSQNNVHRQLHARLANRVNYTGKVYCVTLERNHVMLVRRNGHAVFCGNCGSGNLEYPLRSENLYMSTLHDSEINYINSGMFGDAVAFQFDFLNDPVEKMPEKLRNYKGKMLVLMNPPYAEAGNGVSKGVEGRKDGVSNTEFKKEMASLGLAKRELFIQFLWRVKKLWPQATVAFYAKLKYINAPAFEKFREQWQYEFKGGFVFPASAFHGTRGKWPVSFDVWEPKKESDHNTDFVVYDVRGARSERSGLGRLRVH